jgi:hypothetical protein
MNWQLFMIGMTETWREGRKLVDHSLRPGAVMAYGQMMQDKTHEFLAQLFVTPQNFRSHVELSVGRLPYYRMTIDGQVAFKENLSCQSLMATI